MVDVVDVRTRQRVVFVFLTVEGSSLIRRRLRSVYGDDARDISAVRCWLHCFKSGEKEGHW